MNRILTLMIALLVLGIALSRTNDILIALSPYEFTSAEPAPAATAAVPVEESELAGRVALSP